MVGAFDFEDTLWGAVLIGPDGAPVHQWRLSTEHMAGNREPPQRKVLYGVSPLPDGSIIFTMQEDGGGLVRVDACGRPVWGVDGAFHHTVQPRDPAMTSFWTFEGGQEAFDHVLARLDTATGEVLERIDMADVRRANPDLHIFDLQRNQDAEHPVHGNDIDPLPAERAAAFPGFAAGDLLVSFNTTNLVFVLDPRTLRVTWWRVGPWDRQHDPDWGADGRITVYSNAARARDRLAPDPVFSAVIAIDPATLAHETLLDGRRYNHFDPWNGTHQVTPAGSILVTSSTQGRAFEIGPDGRVLFSFLNTVAPADGGGVTRTLHLSDAFFMPLDFFRDGALTASCPPPAAP